MKKVIITGLALLGLYHTILWTAGTLGVGNYYLYYGPDSACVKESSNERP